jgi:hypothetical protein
MNTESKETKNLEKPTLPWLKYGTEILTIFSALAILTGRIYTVSYWNTFGISPDLSDIPFVNYAIVSPNTAVACMFLAVAAVMMLIFFKKQPYDLIGQNSPTFCYIIGWLAFWVGAFTAGIITQCDLSSWPNGTVGLVLGLAYFFAFGGQIVLTQAMLKNQKDLSKTDKVFLGWLRKIPIILIQVIIVLSLVSAALWGIFATAEQFGTNEAKMTYNIRPIVTIQLDSPVGFVGFDVATNPDSTTLNGVRIIKEAGELIYIAGLTNTTPQKLYIRVVPTSRVKAIQYEMVAPPIGK